MINFVKRLFRLRKENKNAKRLKELSELNKMGLLSNEEFEKLKSDLV